MNTDYNKQAIDFLNATSTTFTTKFKNFGYPEWDKLKLHDCFSCVFKNKNSRYRFDFWQSINQTTGEGDNPPTAYDVLAGMQKREVGSFENFCSDFGYDTDSRSAYKTYKAVMKEWKNVELLFTPEQIEILQEIY